MKETVLFLLAGCACVLSVSKVAYDTFKRSSAKSLLNSWGLLWLLSSLYSCTVLNDMAKVVANFIGQWKM